MEVSQRAENAAISDDTAPAQPSTPESEKNVGRNGILRRQNSEGFKRRVGSRREESDHEIIRRRSSRALVSDGPSNAPIAPQIGEELEHRPTLNRSISGERRRSYSAVPENFLRRGSHSSSSSLSPDQVDERKGKKHTELVERFQIRHLHRSPSDSTSTVSANRESVRDRNLERSHSVRSSTGAPSKHAESSSTAPNPPVRPTNGMVVGIPFSSDLEPRPLNSYRSIQTHRKETTLATSRQYEIDHPKALGLRDRFKRFCWSLTQPMSPLSTSFRTRQIVMIMALVVHVIHFPLAAAFHYSRVGSQIEMAVEMVFIFDFLLMFNTSVFDKKGMLIAQRGEIARRYLSSWFILDLLSSVPVEWFLVRGESTQADSKRSLFLYNLICRSPRILHCIRLVRFAWAVRLDRSERNVLTWIFYSRYSHLLRIAWIVIALVIVAHYMACCWKLLETSSTPSSTVEEYVSSFYDVLQLLQGQGIPTTSLSQNIFAAVATLAGSLLLAIVFGNVGILVSNFNANSTSYQRKMESVFAIMSKLKLPAPLRERIHQYYEHLWREYESLDGEIVAFSKGLSHTLELEVVLFKYMDLIMHVPFWRDGSPDFQKQLMLSLHVRVYLPDDFIIRRGEVGDEFFMINRGICELVLGPDSLETTTEEALECSDGDGSASSNVRSGRGVSSQREGNSTARNEIFDKLRAPLTARQDGGKTERDRYPEIRLLRRGQTFGELALLMNYERTANVRALSYVEMCVLKREDVQRIFVKHSRDRKAVITDLLTRAMESNELHNVRCPLKAMVQNALPDHDDTRISAMHAAWTIASAIDVEREDDSIRFGIGPSLGEQLQNMVGGRRDPIDDRRAYQTFHSSERSSGRQDRLNEHELRNNGEVQQSTLQKALNRIASLEETQAQLLQLVHDMHNEVREMKRAYTEVARQSPQPASQPKEFGCDLSLHSSDTFSDSSDTSSRVIPVSFAPAGGMHAAVSTTTTGTEALGHATISEEVVKTETGDAISGGYRVECPRDDTFQSLQRRSEVSATNPSLVAREDILTEAGREMSDGQLLMQSSSVTTASSASQVKRDGMPAAKVRPQMRGRRASYREPGARPPRLAPRTSMGKLPELQTLQTTKESPRADDCAVDDEQVDHVEEIPPVRTNLQPQQARPHSRPRLSHRPSLLAPLRNLMSSLTPGNTHSSASPYADQLFHTRSDRSGRSGRYDDEQPIR